MKITIALFAYLITPIPKLSISVGSLNPKTLAEKQTSVVKGFLPRLCQILSLYEKLCTILNVFNTAV